MNKKMDGTTSYPLRRWIPPVSMAAIMMIAALFVPSLALAQAFEEGWESAARGRYTPEEFFLPADEGTWIIGDTVSEFPECGATPHMAEIIQNEGSHALRLTSSDTNSSCSDNVWVELTDTSRLGQLTLNQGFAVSLTTGTRIAFKQSGALFEAQQQGWGRNCLGPPCFDSIAMQLIDNRGNILSYVLQRPPAAEANVPNSHFGDRYREIFLDPNAGIHNRNLFDDFDTMPGFVSSNAQVLSISLEVDEHGWAIFDDISIGTDIEPPVLTAVLLDSGGASGAWYSPSRSGEGFFVEIVEIGNQNRFVVTWYTYDGNRNQMWIGGNVLIPAGATSITVPVTVTSGPIFGDAFDASDVEYTPWGNLTFRFSNCDSGVVSYDSSIGFGSGTINLVRLTNLKQVTCR